MRVTLTKVMQKMGYEIAAEAETGTEAVKLYKEMSPDLTIMDITMPELNGIDAVKEIIGFDPDAKIIMCSAMGQRILVMEALDAGAKDFIVKPFEEERIIETVRRLLS